MAAVPSIGRASLVEPAVRAPQAAVTAGLYERHAGKLFGYCYHQLGSREEAEDAVQTTFMNAFRALGRGVVPESETAWLYKIAENVCLSRRRSSWRRGRIESPSDFEVIEEIVPGPSRQSDELIGIEDALASMPEQQRRAILLREWQGLSYREIAEELEVSQSAVETLIFRARRSLAQGLEQPQSLKPKRKGLRRALHAFDLGTIAAALKTLLAGSAAAKATAAAVAVTAAAGTAAGVGHELESKRHAPLPVKEAVVAPVPTAKASTTRPNAVVRSAAPAGAVVVSSDAVVAPNAKAKAATAARVTSRTATARPQPRPARPAPAAVAPAASVPAPAPEVVAAPPAAEAPRPAEQSTGGEQTRATQAAPTERKPDKQAEKQAERREEKRGAREEQAPPAPSAVTAPVTLVAAPASDERERGKRRRHEQKAETAPLPVPAPVVDAAAPATGEQPAPAAPQPGAQPAAEAAAPSAPASEAGREREDRGSGNGRRRK